MLESEFREKQVKEENKEKTVDLSESGIGAVLREKREKLGLDLEQIAGETRLRSCIIEALENEDWDSLPPSVFVRGFIRAYARALALDEIQTLELYKGSGAVQSTETKPLVEPSRSRIWRFFLILLILAVLGVAVFWYLSGHFVDLKAVPGQEPKQAEVEKIGAQLPAEKGVEKKPEEKVVPVQPTEEAKPLISEVQEPEEKFLSVGEEDSAVVDEENFAVSNLVEPAQTPGGHVLQIAVTERTWMRVYIDDEAPREYIFQSGSYPQWKAKKGFNLIVGNAAGIAIDFNGTRVENLGKVGQVIRLFFPEDFRSEKYED